jgi:hypothetical protein
MGGISRTWLVWPAAFALLAWAGLCLAAEGYKGWERGGSYNRLYDPDKAVTIKGRVVRTAEVVPMAGMDPGLALIVKTAQGEEIEVQLGPKPFAKSIAGAFSPGAQAKAKGVWAEIGGRKVFMAAKVRLEEFRDFKLRLTKDGYPAWDYKGLWQ